MQTKICITCHFCRKTCGFTIENARKNRLIVKGTKNNGLLKSHKKGS